MIIVARRFFEIERLLGEFLPVEQPRLVVLENVPNLMYGGDRAWFNAVRRSLRSAGYWFREESCWKVNVKDATALPQDRERLFMVGASRQHFSYNPFTPPEKGKLTSASQERLWSPLLTAQNRAPMTHIFPRTTATTR